MPDEDGYPTPEELKKVETWDSNSNEDIYAWFTYVKSLWNFGDTEYWSEETKPWDEPYQTTPKTIETKWYRISTVGWSGNENLIKAMQKNFNWHWTWWSSRRGGHYEFRVTKLE